MRNHKDEIAATDLFTPDVSVGQCSSWINIDEAQVPMTTQESAYTSPVWYTP